MSAPIFVRQLQERRRPLIGWAIGIALISLLSVSLYPSVRDSDFQELLKNIPSVMRQMFSLDVINTPAGYLNARHFSLTAPLLIMIFSIGMGSDVIAGEEERGTMDLLLSHPVSRVRVVGEKAAALILCTLGIQAVSFAVIAIFAPLVDMSLSLRDLAAAITSQTLMALTFGGLALAVGCRTGSRGAARAVATALAVASYLLSAFAPLVEWLEPYRPLSLFYQGQGYEPVLTGWSGGHLAVLAVVAAVFAAAAVRYFQRRDVTV